MSYSKHENEDEVIRPSGRYTIPFFLIMAVLTVVSFIIPLRPTQSYSEKRSLAEFPEFSAEALISGSYFDDISLWFSDTFPGRESWISLSREIQSFHGHSDILIQGDIPVNDQNSQAGETIATEESAVSTTAPTEIPEDTIPEETVVLQEVTAPTTPVEEWGGLDVGNAVVNIGAVIQIDDFALGYFNFVEETSNWYAKSLNTLAAALDGKDVNIISAPPPSAIGIMVENEYMEMLGCKPQDVALDYLHSKMDESIITVDTVRNLIPHNDEYLFFRTDHHWAPMGAYYTYELIMETMGYEPATLDSFEAWDQGEFHGSYYYRCANPSKLTPDNVIAYIPQGDIHTMLYDNSGSGFEWDLLTDMTKSDVGSKYMTFLAGDHALSVITNNSIPDAPNCLIIKDSYGNCFVPFMTQNYHKVYAIDYRKYTQMSISKFVEKYDIQDVFMMPNLGACQNAEVNRLIQSLCK